MKWFPKYHLSILCFDGEGDGDGGAGDAGTPPADGGDGGDGGGDEKKFSQVELNKIIAVEDRKAKDKLRKLETSLQTMSEDRNLSDKHRETLAIELEDLQKSQRTEKQQSEYERKQAAEQHKVDLEAATKRADLFENMYRESTIDRALQDAAGNSDAYRPSQIVSLLRPDVVLKDVEGVLTPMVNFPETDETTGEAIVTLRTPADAVKRMTEMKQEHGNLFNSGVVSGVGSGSGADMGKDNIDYASLTTEQYRKIRADNPERLGLPRNRQRKEK